ncbi:MAG: hypothetical protein E6J52_13145, partial [Chloroflexi bacterium]
MTIAIASNSLSPALTAANAAVRSAQTGQRTIAVLGDLALEGRAHVEVLEDRADPLDVLGPKGRGRREERVEFGARLRRRLLERENDGER